MPRFTIELPQKAVDRLNVHVARTNEANGTALTLQQWLDLHVRELAISDDLSAAMTTIQQENETAARDALSLAVRAEREKLLSDLEA